MPPTLCSPCRNAEPSLRSHAISGASLCLPPCLSWSGSVSPAAQDRGCSLTPDLKAFRACRHLKALVLSYKLQSCTVSTVSSIVACLLQARGSGLALRVHPQQHKVAPWRRVPVPHPAGAVPDWQPAGCSWLPIRCEGRQRCPEPATGTPEMAPHCVQTSAGCPEAVLEGEGFSALSMQALLQLNCSLGF